nr:syndetin-like [Onthophagus taurus]
MDDLKHKILSLINKQNTKIPSMGFSDSSYHFPQETLSINSKTVTESDRPADQDILESIEAAYFSMSPDFDICRFELSKLPDVLDCDQIQRDFKNLKQQHQVVSKKVLQLILEHQTACNGEFQDMLVIYDQLKEALGLCRGSRKNLEIAERQFSDSLGILANYRKRKLVQNLLKSLVTIRNLHHTDFTLQKLLHEDNYPGAIELLIECRTSANTYRHFTCVAALTNKLQETLEYTEEQLDRVLAQMCYYFDGVKYDKLQQAFKLLGKTQIAVDHLHMHYISAIYNTALNIVHMYVSTVDNTDVNDNTGKKIYKNLCLSVDRESFIPCLVDLCKALFKIVLSYHQLVKWHNNQDIDEKVDLEESFNKQYIKQKLDHNLLKIWQDVQNKVSNLLLNGDLASYKFDQFVQVLGIVHRLINVGEEFCGSKSEELQESIRKQSANYFRNYHSQRLDELKIFLENESWEICPVKATFQITQLQEFKSLKSILKQFKIQIYNNQSFSNSQDGNDSSNHSQDGSSVTTGHYFIRYIDHGTPFDGGLDETIVEEDILASVGDDSSCYFSEDSDEDEEENEELKKDFVDEEYADETVTNLPEKKRKSKAPILTNTTLTVLRQIGKYLQMSRLLRPIALDIILCMNQLFDYYLFAVHEFFAADLTVSSNNLYSQKLNSVLKRINDNLICCGDSDENGKIPKPILSPIVDLKRSEQLHGLAERVVAVESVIFLSKQYELLEEYLEYLVPSQNKVILQQFYNQTINTSSDLRRPVYMTVAAQAFDFRQILIAMTKINWEIKDVMSQHNAYIDIILREVQIFTMCLDQVSLKVYISDEVLRTLWENIAHIITHTLVQGFSEAKKCSNGGRALMQLDFTQFLSKFEKISQLKPVPHREYVENYVKAYYLPENELEKWIKDHSEYSLKHMFGLVSCVCQNNKKTKQRLIQVIEEKYNPR